MHAPAHARPFTVLAVCTGNICRSPAVERLLAHELGADTPASARPTSDVVVASAGVGAVVGAPVPAPMVALLEAAGVSAAGFAARQLSASLLQEADLILPLTRAHRSRVVAVHPAAVRRTFTLRELARLCEGVDADDLPRGTTADRLHALIPLAAAQRGRRRPDDPAADDVVDPYGGDDALFARSFAELRPAVATIARLARAHPERPSV